MLRYKKIAFLFPGQGAQTVGMGKDFYENFSVAKEVYQEADHHLNRSLSTIVFEGPLDQLTLTKNSQSGIFVTSLALLKVLQSQFSDLIPTVTAGLSLGEYSALCASRRLDFNTCLSLVDARSSAMNEACESVQGTMAAIFGLSNEQIESIVKEPVLKNALWVANYNCPGQTVISGTLKGVELGIEKALAMGAKRAIPLKVHGAFHSGLMQQAEKQLAPHLKNIHFQESSIDFVMNVPGNYVKESENIRQFLIQQVTSSVRWEQSIQAMSSHVDLMIEIGCGKTLTGLNKSIVPHIPTLAINKVQDLETLAHTLERT